MGCVFSETMRSFRPLLSEDHDHGQVQLQEKKVTKKKITSRLRKTSVKFAKMESKTSLYLPCGCQNKRAKKCSEKLTIEDAIRMRDKGMLLNIMFNSEDDTGWTVSALDIKKKNCERSNPVLLACQLGYADMVEVFLENGCSPNLPTKTGRLIHSVLESMKSKHLDIKEGRHLLKTLLDRGCDVNIKDNKGTTTLLYCAELGDEETMKLILTYASDSQFTTRCGGSLYTPLHMSVMKYDLSIIKLLLSHNPKRHINSQDSFGNTPLLLSLQSMLHTCSGKYISTEQNVATEHLVFRHNMISIVETLLNSGADPNITKLPSNREMNFLNFIWNTPLALALQLTVNGMESPKQIPIGVLTKLCNPSKISASNSLVKNDQYLCEESTDLVSAASSCDNLVTALVNCDSDEDDLISPYAGVVRLLIQSGARLEISKEEMCRHYPSLVSLVNEIYEYCSRNNNEKPPKLIHLTKQLIRQHLGSVQQLHQIDSLPLPKRMKDYIGLRIL